MLQDRHLAAHHHQGADEERGSVRRQAGSRGTGRKDEEEGPGVGPQARRPRPLRHNSRGEEHRRLPQVGFYGALIYYSIKV